MKLLNDLKLQFEKELWALNPELAVVDTILSDHPEIIETVRDEITGSKPSELFNHSAFTDNWKGTGTVLLVDDEETIRSVGKEMLQELGFAVITATDGREAVAIFRSNPEIELVILDLTMPHMNGEQCFGELNEIRPGVKVIMSSGFDEQEITQKFAGKGLAGFIQKPYTLSMLKDAIKTITSNNNA